MIRIALTGTLLWLGAAGSAWADRLIEQPEDAYELTLSDVIMPGSESGTLIFKTCDECNPLSMRVDGRTRYLLNWRPVTLDAFMRSVDSIRQTRRGNEGATVYVFFDVKDQHVNRLGVEYVDIREGQDGRR